jgi:D-psicose/D-tagatose/L-ribulose 3-epimerase
MHYNRRDFIKTSAGLAGASMLGWLGCNQGQETQWQGFEYAMCNEIMKGWEWARQCELIGQAGYTGVEIAPFSLVEKGVQEISASERNQMVQDMKNAGIECAGLHWLLAPPPAGLHFTTPDKSVRDKSIDYLNQLIDFCGDLEGPVMIFGSPNQRNTQGISVEEAKKHFADGLSQVADHAQKRGVKILIETLDTSQTDVVNTMAEAYELMQEVNHPAIRMMFDFHNTPDETKSFVELVQEYYEYIEHVHVQEMDGDYLGTGNAVNEYIDALQVLKNRGYDKWVSLEVFNFEPAPKTVATESMATLKKMEAKLV